MDTMALQLDSQSCRFVEHHGPWHHRDQRYNKGDGVELERRMFETAAMISSLTPALLKPGPKVWSPQVEATSKSTHCGCETSSSLPPTKQGSCDSGPSSTTTGLKSNPLRLVGTVLGSAPAFSFPHVVLPLQQVFSFPPDRQSHIPRQGIKRRRPLSDVDGPNTATVGCKKRRLRRNLITSRLSRPFSLPATHIINRESVAMGDRRFLKLAAILSARRMSSATATPVQQGIHPSPSSLLRRAAVINRFRLRVLSRAAERGDDQVADMAANAALLQQSQGIGLVVGARFPAASSSSTIPPTPLLCIPGQGVHPHPLSQAAVEARSLSGSPGSKAVADPPGLRISRSPRLRPVRSPELRTSRPPIVAGLDEEEYLDDDDAAFPTSEYESRYESSEEPDDVYADFGVIFGGGGADDFSDEEGDHYEDYMDDMDGIPWTAR